MTNLEESNPQAAENLVKSMTQEIEHLRQNLVAHLSADIERLQQEKYQLIEDIEQLETQRQQQIVQQQQLALQFVPTLVNQLQELLIERLDQLAVSSTASEQNPNLSLGLTQEGLQTGTSSTKIKASSGFPQTSQASVTQENADQLIVSLDTTLRATFRALQQDINSYQSSLSQQLGQMYSMEQQGTAILEALVSRLRQELQVDSSPTQSEPVTPTTSEQEQRRQGSRGRVSEKKGGETNKQAHRRETHQTRRMEIPPKISLTRRGRENIAPNPSISPPIEPAVPPPELPPQVSSPTTSSPKWKPRLGWFLLLLSLLALSLENVVVTAMFHKSPIFGVTELGGLITPNLSSSLLLLWLRMLVILPLMSLLAHVLYPAVWRELKKLIQSPDWSLCGSIVGSGFCLFLSQVLIYLALGTISPGVAVTIFFIYPLAIAFWRWRGLGRYPNPIIRWALLSVLVGVVLSIVQSSVSGGLAAAVAGIAFAGHMLLKQTSKSKLNPIPMRLIHAVIVFFFSTLGLLFTQNNDLALDSFLGLIIGGVILGGAALVSYFLEQVSHKLPQSTKAPILVATVPVLTAFVALVLLQQVMSPLQILGMLLVSLGVAALHLSNK